MVIMPLLLYDESPRDRGDAQVKYTLNAILSPLLIQFRAVLIITILCSRYPHLISTWLIWKQVVFRYLHTISQVFVSDGLHGRSRPLSHGISVVSVRSTASVSADVTLSGRSAAAVGAHRRG